MLNGFLQSLRTKTRTLTQTIPMNFIMSPRSARSLVPAALSASKPSSTPLPFPGTYANLSEHISILMQRKYPALHPASISMDVVMEVLYDAGVFGAVVRQEEAADLEALENSAARLTREEEAWLRALRARREGSGPDAREKGMAGLKIAERAVVKERSSRL